MLEYKIHKKKHIFRNEPANSTEKKNRKYEKKYFYYRAVVKQQVNIHCCYCFDPKHIQFHWCTMVISLLFFLSSQQNVSKVHI